MSRYRSRNATLVWITQRISVAHDTVWVQNAQPHATKYHASISELCRRMTVCGLAVLWSWILLLRVPSTRTHLLSYLLQQPRLAHVGMAAHQEPVTSRRIADFEHEVAEPPARVYLHGV